MSNLTEAVAMHLSDDANLVLGLADALIMLSEAYSQLERLAIVICIFVSPCNHRCSLIAYSFLSYDDALDTARLAVTYAHKQLQQKQTVRS